MNACEHASYILTAYDFEIQLFLSITEASLSKNIFIVCETLTLKTGTMRTNGIWLPIHCKYDFSRQIPSSIYNFEDLNSWLNHMRKRGKRRTVAWELDEMFPSVLERRSATYLPLVSKWEKHIGIGHNLPHFTFSSNTKAFAFIIFKQICYCYFYTV